MPDLQAVVPPPPTFPPMQVVDEPIDPLLAEFIYPPPPGRNEDCWCGSGDKYKKCHLDIDQEAWRFVMQRSREADAAFAFLHAHCRVPDPESE